MPARDQVRALLARGLDYADAGRRLDIPAGQAYMIATGQAAKKRAPIRPHPHPPEKPGAAVKAGADGAAVLDKARDAAGDRPAEHKGRPE